VRGRDCGRSDCRSPGERDTGRPCGCCRDPSYDRWYGLLPEELVLVATSGAQIFAVGAAVEQHPTRRSFPRPPGQLRQRGIPAMRARSFFLIRDGDETGGLGTGVVAEGVQLSNGRIALG
jgi:hypothetical protein